MVFDPATVKTERIKEDAGYEGVRVRFVGLTETPQPLRLALHGVMRLFCSAWTLLSLQNSQFSP
jgi:hypothetical protein